MKLYELAKVIRSKNSGPFSTTLDVLFDNYDDYEKIKNSNIINKELISTLYKIECSKIDDIVFFDAAQGVKITFERDISSGSAGDRDVYGAQQHAPLFSIEV